MSGTGKSWTIREEGEQDGTLYDVQLRKAHRMVRGMPLRCAPTAQGRPWYPNQPGPCGKVIARLLARSENPYIEVWAGCEQIDADTWRMITPPKAPTLRSPRIKLPVSERLVLYCGHCGHRNSLADMAARR